MFLSLLNKELNIIRCVITVIIYTIFEMPLGDEEIFQILMNDNTSIIDSGCDDDFEDEQAVFDEYVSVDMDNMDQYITVEEVDGIKGDTVDRLWKVRPLYDQIRKVCQALPLETDLCIDEQSVPFKAQINIKQYIKNRHNK